MGVLDDAIRQHLELKRAHGAAADEVQRQEHEALGPARREQPAEAEAVVAPQAEPAQAEVVEEAVPEPEPAPAPEPEPEPEPPPTGDTPTRGFDAIDEPVVEEPPAADSEDVLEETPEFLQETPEHDRLWFEQKPPRDFDFDE
jgi:hypothetical protein